MWHINKTRPPEEFVEYCKTPGVSYEGLSGEPKKKLRKRLVEDQGYICCYSYFSGNQYKEQCRSLWYLCPNETYSAQRI